MGRGMTSFVYVKENGKKIVGEHIDNLFTLKIATFMGLAKKTNKKHVQHQKNHYF